MFNSLLDFRKLAAEFGAELTPDQAKRLYKPFIELKDHIKQACINNPDFYRIICNRTTEEKLDDMQQFVDNYGGEFRLKDYNEIQYLIKLICKIEGYDKL